MSRPPHPRPRDEQFQRVGAAAAKAGDMLAANGPTVWDMFRQWLPGPRAANLDPDAGGWRYEEDTDGTVWPVPSDPTGEAAMPHTDAAAHLHGNLHEAMQELERWSLRVMELCSLAVRSERPATDDPTAWCSNHLRIGVCEPRHRGDLCRWCDDFRREHRNQLPPASLLGARHRGTRITERMVEAAMRELRKKAG